MRRQKIIDIMKKAQKPISGEALGRATGVSRQVIVQDIALLRTEGFSVSAAPRGYYLDGPRQPVRLFKVRHTCDRIEDELTTIVDLGGRVADVIISHKAYGKISGVLNIKSRRDIKSFMEQLRTGKSQALSEATSGYHYHHVYAETEDILDEIEDALRRGNFLVEFLPYEQEDAERE